MQLTLMHGYPDLIGRRSAFAGFGNGPAAYTTGGDPVTLGTFNYYIDAIEGNGFTVSGNYYVVPIPSKAGPRATWKLKWFTQGTNTEVGNGTNLSAESLILSGLGGLY